MFDSGFLKKPRIVAGHKCSLESTRDHVIHYVSDGIFVNFRRHLRTYLMVDATAPQSRALLRSTARIAEERDRHLLWYCYMIHPFSKGRFHWETFMIVIYAILFIFIPLEVVLPQSPTFIVYFTWILYAICWIDIVLFFFTGYLDEERQKVVMNPKMVAMRYLKSYFVLDVLSSLPLKNILNHHGLLVKDGHLTLLSRLKWLSMLKIARFFTLPVYLNRFYERLHFRAYHLKFINFVLTLMLVIIWSATAKTIILEYRRGSSVKKLYEDLRNVLNYLVVRLARQLKKLLLIGYEPNYDKLTVSDSTLMGANIFLLACGFILQVVIMVKMTQFHTMKASTGRKYNRLLNQIADYMKYRELPPMLREKILVYVNFKFQKNMFKESEIMNTISKALKQDLLLNNCKDLIQKVDFFKDLPEAVMLRIIVQLKIEVYLKNDVIFSAGSIGTSMFFISLGSVAVYTPNDIEICHLHEGDHFGEIALFVNKLRTASIVAISECEVFKLSRRDLFAALEPYPDLIRNIKSVAMERLKHTISIGGGLDGRPSPQSVMEV